MIVSYFMNSEVHLDKLENNISEAPDKYTIMWNCEFIKMSKHFSNLFEVSYYF